MQLFIRLTVTNPLNNVSDASLIDLERFIAVWAFNFIHGKSFLICIRNIFFQKLQKWYFLKNEEQSHIC
jgi:hypothetical protein